jgi:hypothetical protein
MTAIAAPHGVPTIETIAAQHEAAPPDKPAGSRECVPHLQLRKK